MLSKLFSEDIPWFNFYDTFMFLVPITIDVTESHIKCFFTQNCFWLLKIPNLRCNVHFESWSVYQNCEMLEYNNLTVLVTKYSIDSNIGYLRDSLTVSVHACHAAEPGSNPAQGDDFFN